MERRTPQKRHTPQLALLDIARRGRVLVLTGAGVSADSGVPTFRDEKGYWRKHDARALATRKAFRTQPEKVWRWYSERRRTIRNARPNAAHKAIARLARASREFLLITQNVDDLHERAGLPVRKLVHIHGSIFLDRCTNCDFERRNRNGVARPPRCPKCKALLRPGVVWFDEDLNPDDVGRIETFVKRPCDLVLVVGTMATFPYIVRWALRGARRSARLVEVNLKSSRITTHAGVTVFGRAAEVLPELVG